MSKRREFSPTTCRQEYDRAEGKCRSCRQPLQPGRIQYDHLLPCALGGDNSLANCRVLCTSCHEAKTSKEDVPRIRKADRQKNGHIGAKAATAPIPQRPKQPAPPQHKATKPTTKFCAGMPEIARRMA